MDRPLSPAPLRFAAIVAFALAGLLPSSACFSPNGGGNASGGQVATALAVGLGIPIVGGVFAYLAQRPDPSPCREPKLGEAYSDEQWDALADCQQAKDMPEKAESSRAMAAQIRARWGPYPKTAR